MELCEAALPGALRAIARLPDEQFVSEANKLRSSGVERESVPVVEAAAPDPWTGLPVFQVDMLKDPHIPRGSCISLCVLL